MQLHEQYCPTTWAEVVGQDKVLAKLDRLRKRGLSGRSFWVTGASGQGKTSIARLIATEVASEWCIEEIDATDLSAARVRDLERQSRTYGIGEKTGRAYIVNEAQLVIAFPRSVLATISVKTTLDSTTVADTIEGLNSVRRTAVDQTGVREIWCAGYFFEVGSAVVSKPTSVYDHFIKAIAAHPVRTPVLPDPHPVPLGPDLLCSAKDLAYRFDHGHSSDSSTTVPPRIMGFDCNGLATALFLANLLAHIANARGLPHTDFGDFANHVKLAGLDEPYRDVAEPS